MTEDTATAPDISAENVARMLEGTTPLPWRFGVGRPLRNDGARSIMGADKRIALIDMQTVVTRKDAWKVECAERDANARFIAWAREAVPAMAEALKVIPSMTAALNVVEAQNEKLSDDLKAAEAKLAASEARVEKLREALAKIEGKDSYIDASIRSDGPDRKVIYGEFARIARAALEGDKP